MATTGRIPLRVIERLGVPRASAPVTVGVPLVKGTARSANELRVLNPSGKQVPSQIEPLELAPWPDGSLKAARVTFFADVPAESSALYALEYGRKSAAVSGPRRGPQSPIERALGTPIRLEESADLLRVDTGPLAFSLSKKRFRLFESLSFAGAEMLDPSPPRGLFVTSPQDKCYDAALDPAPQFAIESRGPLRAAIFVRGQHRAPDGDAFMDFEVRIECWAGSPLVKVAYGFYNTGQHVEELLVNPGRGALFRVSYSSLRDCRLKLPLRLEGAPKPHRTGRGDPAAPAESLLGGYQHYVHRVRGDASLFYAWMRREHGREGLGHLLCHRGEDRFLYPGTLADSSSGALTVDQGGGRTMQIRYGPHEMNSCALDVPDEVDHPDGTHERFFLGAPDGWIDLSDGRRGVAVCVRDFDKFPPKLIQIRGNAIDLALWPSRAGDLAVGQGAGKSHEIFILCHEGSGAERKIDWACEALREPLVASVDPEWIQRCGLFGDVYPAAAAREPQSPIRRASGTPNRPDFERRCRQAFAGEPRPQPSLWDYPESPITTVTDKAVTHNNDGDRVMCLLLQYLRTGEPEYFLAARAQALHTMDVDFVRYSPDPLLHEGLHMHSYDHVTGVCLPSHSWIEGLLFYYYITGEPQALGVAKAVGRHLARQVFHPRLLCYCDEREAGWPLIMLSQLYVATGDAEVRRAAEHLVKMLDDWQDKESGVWHIRWRQGCRYRTGGGGFMRAVIFCGLYKWWAATGDERAREVFRRGIVSFANEVAEMTDFSAREFLNLEALAYAWKMLGDRACVEKGLHAWQYLTRMGMGAYPVTDTGQFRSLFQFMHVADAIGLLGGGPKAQCHGFGGPRKESSPRRRKGVRDAKKRGKSR